MKIISTVVIILVLVGGGFLLLRDGTEDGDSSNEEIFCIQDVRECSDGSFVPRVPPTCEFRECPLGSRTLEIEEVTESTGQVINPDDTTQIIDEGGMVFSSSEIIYTNEGFGPESITIKKGETVVFTNKSDRDFWPASNIHPTHGTYPEKTSSDCLGSAFDACKPITSGKNYSFIFNEIGEWSYHDHLRASRGGKIIVQ